MSIEIPSDGPPDDFRCEKCGKGPDVEDPFWLYPVPAVSSVRGPCKLWFCRECSENVIREA